jgi:uncharacterized protein (DUF2147 family)
MKKLTLLFSLLLGFSTFAQEKITTTALTAATVANALSGKYLITNVRVVANTTNNVIKLYDWATAATNVVRASYVSVESYATNYTTVSTDSAGLSQTNTFSGWYTGYVTNAAATNEQTQLLQFTVPASTTRDIPIRLLVARGLTVLPLQSGTLEVTYQELP